MPNPRFVTFVDTHGFLPADLKRKIRKEKPDFLVCAGDFTVFGRDTEKHLREIAKLHKKIFLVHGNHEEERVVATLCRKLKIRMIHRKIAHVGASVLVGYGGGGFASRDLALEAWTKEIRRKVKAYKKKGKHVIVVAHAPFYHCKLDALYGSHLGSKSLRKLILDVKADIAVCGHFHENAGKEDKIRRCVVVNPGPKGKILVVNTP